MDAFVILLTVGCTYQNEEEQDQTKPDCDIGNVSYLADIKPILQRSCYNCHTASFPSGNVALDSHEGVTKVTSGHLLPAINHEPGHPPMPQGAAKLPECDIARITKWVNAGALNN